jgi:hypothetical protein
MFRRVSLINQVLRTRGIAQAATTSKKIKPTKLISAKHAKFDFIIDKDEKVGGKKGAEIELVSKGWQHYKAKGDHFTIHPVRNVVESNSVQSVDIGELNLNEQLVTNIRNKHNIDNATKLQQEALVKIRDENKNVLIAAETGCGKV